MNLNKRLIFGIFILLFFNIKTICNNVYYQIDLTKDVGSTTWRYIQKGLKAAKEAQANFVIINMNTYGGTVVHADSIRTAILDFPIPVYVFIDKNAASAGALIAIACDSIYMSKGANIGAATVVDNTGKQMPDKYQSYMRGTIRSTAESHGKDTIMVNGKKVIRWKRDPRIAEAMVDDRIIIPNIVDSGKVITFTTEEAIQNGYCEGVANSVEELIKDHLNDHNYELVIFKPTLLDKIIGFLTSPVLQAILIMIIVLGIYYELQTPGLGFPSAAALCAAFLYFAPLYLEGLAANWEIILFIIGVIFLIVEIFVIPGFGLFGIIGITAMLGGFIFAMIDNFDFELNPINTHEVTRAIMTVVSGLILGISAILLFIQRVGKKGVLHKLALNTTENVEKGFIGVSLQPKTLIGEKGITATILRPSGKIIIHDLQYDAVALFGYIEKGKSVMVVKYENAQLYVKEV